MYLTFWAGSSSGQPSDRLPAFAETTARQAEDDDDEGEPSEGRRAEVRGLQRNPSMGFCNTKLLLLLGIAVAVFPSLSCRQPAAGSGSRTAVAQPIVRSFSARGIVQQLDADGRTLVIKHEAISNYMAAMTMPFRASNPGELSALRPGDEISFRLLVSDSDSWVDQISKTGKRQASETHSNAPVTEAASSKPSRHPLMDYNFTNELGQAVSLGQFDGQALAITFFFTRCPIPNFCPRLSKNFEEAAEKLSATPNAPTNWHLLSISFDAEFDTPPVLKAYADHYHYNPKHWSFLTGPHHKIAELAQLSGVTVEKDGSFFNHNFRTLIIDAAGDLQMSFPIGGNISDAIAGELLKAAAVTNKNATRANNSGH